MLLLLYLCAWAGHVVFAFDSSCRGMQVSKTEDARSFGCLL